MKTNLTLLTVIFLALGITATKCSSFITKGIKPSNNIITRDYKVSGFDQIQSSAIAEINYVQSTDGTYTLQIYGPDNFVELVTVSVKDNKLSLNMAKKNIKNAHLKIKISSPELKEVKLSSVASFNIENSFKAETFNAYSDGVGAIQAKDIKCTNLSVSISGVGDARIAGETENAILKSHGVGSIDANNLKADNVVANSNGVGNILCYATKSLKAKANGVGSISYKGNPTEKELKKNGIGSIKQQ